MANKRHIPRALNESAVIDIRANYVKRKPGFTVPAFAKKYNVSTQTIISVLARRTWAHLQLSS